VVIGANGVVDEEVDKLLLPVAAVKAVGIGFVDVAIVAPDLVVMLVVFVKFMGYNEF
jgi:hypothetical protein